MPGRPTRRRAQLHQINELCFMPHLFRYHRFALLVLVISLTLLTPWAVLAQTDPDARSQQLLDQLENGDPLQQEQASQELVTLASPALLPDLTRIFRVTDNPRPVAAVLGAVGTPAANAVLVGGLADEDLTPQRNAAQLILLEMGVEAVPSLMVGLQNQNSPTRRNAAIVLGFIKSPRAGNSLLRAAQSDEDAMQFAAWHLRTLEGRHARIDTREENGPFAEFVAACGLTVGDTVITMSKGRRFLNRTAGAPWVYGLAGHALS